MTWKERRTITILSAILAVLSAALLIVLGMKYRAARTEAENTGDQAEPGLADTQNEYQSLCLDNGSTTLSFSLNEEGKWVWSDDPSFPLDDSTVTTIIDELSSLTPQQTITEGDTLENYGLSSPRATLTAATANGEMLTLALGKATTDGDSYYMLLNNDESTVYIIADTLYRYMLTPIYDMMALPELPELPESQIQTITIRGAAAEDGSAGPATVLTAQHTDSETSWRSGGANVTDDTAVRALLEKLASLSFVKCVDYRPSAEAASICGFGAPSATLDVAYAADTGVDQTLTLTIGAVAEDGSGRYVQLGEDDTIYLLPTDSLDPVIQISVNGLEA